MALSCLTARVTVRFLQKPAQQFPPSQSPHVRPGEPALTRACGLSYSQLLDHRARSAQQEVAVPWRRSRGERCWKMPPTPGPGGDLDGKVRPSVSPVLSVSKGRKTKGQGTPLALLIAC